MLEYDSALLTTSRVVPVALLPLPDPLAWPALASASLASTEPATDLASALAGVREEIKWWSPMPCVLTISATSSRLHRLSARSADYAFALTIRRTRPTNAGLPLYGGPLGLALLPVCSDGIILQRVF